VDERRQTGPGRAAALSDSLTPTRRAEATSGGGVLGFGRSQEAGKVGLTAEDLAAARRREPAAVTLVYTAYAPALYRFFMAAVGDRHVAEDLTDHRGRPNFDRHKRYVLRKGPSCIWKQPVKGQIALEVLDIAAQPVYEDLPVLLKQAMIHTLDDKFALGGRVGLPGDL